MKSTHNIVMGVSAGLLLLFVSCSEGNSNPGQQSNARTIQVQSPQNPNIVAVAIGATDQIVSVPVRPKPIMAELKVPCRVVLAAMAPKVGTSPGIVYESTELSETVAEYVKASAQLERARQHATRLKDLVMHEAASGKDLLDAETEVKELQASLVAMESKLRFTGLTVALCQQLQSGKALVIADVPESQLGMIKKGGRAHVVLNTFPNKQFLCKEIATGSVVDPSTRSVKVRATVDNPDDHLLAGMYGQMLLAVEQRANLTVPVSSLFTALGKSFLFVDRENGEFERREVLVGTQGSDWAEVLQGVQQGEKVVSKGTMLLKALSFGY